MGLLPRTAEVTGSIRFRGRELVGLTERELAGSCAATTSAMIFQDPMSSLNPVLHGRVAARRGLPGAPRRVRQGGRGPGRRGAGAGRHPAARPAGADQYPHEYSGGMRQRAMIAMADDQRPGPDHRRRADHRAGRHGAGADPGHAAARSAGRDRRRDHDDHPRPRGGRRDRAPGAGDVRRHDRRVRAGRGHLRRAADAVHDRVCSARCRTPSCWASRSRPSTARRRRCCTCRRGARSARAARSSSRECREAEPELVRRRAARTPSRCRRWERVAEMEQPQRMFVRSEIGHLDAEVDPVEIPAGGPAA